MRRAAYCTTLSAFSRKSVDALSAAYGANAVTSGAVAISVCQT